MCGGRVPLYAETKGTGNPFPKRGQIMAKIFSDLISMFSRKGGSQGEMNYKEGEDKKGSSAFMKPAVEGVTRG